MAFLAALALGAALIAERTAQGWRAGLSDRLTVQIVPPTHGMSLDDETDAALAVLRAAPGIAHAAPLTQEQTLALVEPWIGAGALVAELPLPRLIDATIAPGAGVDLAALSRALKQAAPDSLLDDHARWIGRLKGLAETIVWSGLRHPAADRDRDGGGGVVRDARRPRGPSRDGRAAASDGRAVAFHRARLRAALFRRHAGGGGGRRGAGGGRLPRGRRA